MLQRRWDRLGLGRVSPIVPGTAVVVGVILAFLDGPWVGAGVVIGAGLASLNGILLSRRVELAADTGDIARALLVMQVGLFTSFVIIGVATIIMVKISLTMTIASVASFAATHLALLAVFYWTRARVEPAVEREAS